MKDSRVAAVLDRIDGYGPDVVSMQAALTALPALAPEAGGRGESAKAAAVRGFLEEIGGCVVEELPCPDPRVPGGFRPNLIALFPGEKPARRVWVLSHLDVVPPGDPALWTGDPYTLRVESGRLIGRGVEDNQQGIVSSLIAVKALRDAGLRPVSDVGLAIVSDEETGSAFGLAHVLAARPDLFRSTDWIVVPDAGNTDGTLIEIAEKSILWVRCTVEGKQCHGSEPDKGANAAKAAAYFAVAVDGFYREFPLRDGAFDPPVSTFEPTRRDANVPNVNTIPGLDVACFDFRILPSVDPERVKASLRRVADGTGSRFGVRVSLEFLQDAPAAPPTDADADVVTALVLAVRDVTGREARPRGIGGGTVAAHFRRAGLPAVCWQTIEDTAHMPDESCLIGNVLTDAKVFAHLFLQAP